MKKPKTLTREDRTLILNIEANLVRRQTQWQKEHDEFVTKSADLAFEQWLQSMRDKFARDASERFCAENPTPTFESAADAMLKPQLSVDSNRASQVARLASWRGDVKPAAPEVYPTESTAKQGHWVSR